MGPAIVPRAYAHFTAIFSAFARDMRSRVLEHHPHGSSKNRCAQIRSRESFCACARHLRCKRTREALATRTRLFVHSCMVFVPEWAIVGLGPRGTTLTGG